MEEKLKEFAKRYHKLLSEDYAGINLTRILEENEFYTKQILDSILPFEHSKTFAQSLLANKTLVDVGFGGGFPLLPLLFHVEQKINGIGIESKRKKCDVVSEIAHKLDLSAQFIHARVETVILDKAVTVTFKAVGKVNDFLSKLQTTERVQVFFYKGPHFYQQEEEQLNEALKQWDLIEEQNIEVPQVEQRFLIGFQNKKKVLRRTKNSEIVVKLSDII